MKNDREAGETLAYLFEDIEAQTGLALELICAVACTDSDSKRINTGLGDELLDLCGIGVHSVVGVDLNVILNACELTELTLNDNTALVSVLNYLAGQLDILLEGILGAVDHNGGKAAVDAALADIEICAVVEVESNVDARILYGCLSERHKVLMLSILTCACGNLHDNRRLVLLCSLCDSLNNLHIVDVESTDSVAAFISLLKHLCCCYKGHFIHSYSAR